MLKTSVIIVCYNRKKESRGCIFSILEQTRITGEIIVVDNNSTDGTGRIFDSGITSSLLKYFRLEKNRGVSGGRNYGIERATGDILIFLDDDALLEPEDALEKIIKKFENDKAIGILAFKVVNYYTKTIQREEFPHVDKSLDPDKEFETTYFIGAGHAIKKDVFNQCGLYPEDYFYGLEELDLSFRAIDKGYKIIYFPEVVVWHKKSPLGRISDKKKWGYLFRNRLAISYKYLRNRHLFVLSFIWFFKILRESFSITLPFKGLTTFFAYKKKLVKEPVKEETLKKIRKLKGRIWF